MHGVEGHAALGVPVSQREEKRREESRREEKSREEKRRG